MSYREKIVIVVCILSLLLIDISYRKLSIKLFCVKKFFCALERKNVNVTHRNVYNTHTRNS